MAKVFGMHMIALHPGVKAEDFEKFVVAEMYPIFEASLDMKVYLLRGDRGDREGRYLVMTEFSSVEARDRQYPAPGEMSKEIQQIFAAQAALLEKWNSFATPFNVIYTDYIEVGR